MSVLKQIHDELDAAVFDAYGWPHDLTEEQILERLVALNAERVAEERRGLVRWLRPEFQNPEGRTAETQAELEVAKVQSTTKTKKRPWPKELPAQMQAIREALAAHSGPANVEDIAKAFNRANRKRTAELLETLADLGQAKDVGEGRYIP